MTKVALSVLASGPAADAVTRLVPRLVADRFASRLFAKDPTLWGPDATSESAIRLSWVTLGRTSRPLIGEVAALRDHLAEQGLDHVALCGMGGSSLAPEVICATAGVELTVLDSSNPDSVRTALTDRLDRTVVVVSSKSGSTVETDSQRRAFTDAFTRAGLDPTQRIVIVTDPGSPLDKDARAAGYRVINADPNVGGRYSALTAFGLVPSGLAGVDLEQLLDEAESVADLPDELLQRRSGSVDKPRMLGAFNEATPDWLSFHMFTFFTDRDGKMQLESLAQSGFDPLSRTCRFMLTEEAHHMFVGETGIGRTLQRTCEAMIEAGIADPYDIERVRSLGVIDLPTMQRKLNLHYSLSLDLFGSEVSTNAANAFNCGIKGRFHETKIDDDHRLERATYPVLKLVDGAIRRVDQPALTAINMRLRDDYTADCQRGLDRWNKIIAKTGVAFRLALPHVAFHRQIGEFRDLKAAPDGQILDDAAWNAGKQKWLPSTQDGDFIQSLMQPVTEPGKFATWIAPPRVGIDNKPGDFEYVKIAA